MLHLWHFVLAILLFLGVNWIGEHSSAFGYLRPSLHVREVPAPGAEESARGQESVARETVRAGYFAALNEPMFSREKHCQFRYKLRLTL
jgi:hypothetical protein